MMRYFLMLVVLVVLGAVACGMGGCSKTRAEMLRDRSAMVEGKLGMERDRVLHEQIGANRESAISHLQTLRLSLSVVNVSITSVPLLLGSDNEREIGYSVLDEAIGTIDWNIPLYNAPGSSGAGGVRPYPALFSPQTGLDFTAIRQGNGPRGIAK